MRKIAFLPVSIGGGLLAGLIAKKLFGLIWGTISDPSLSQRVPSYVGLATGCSRRACSADRRRT